VIGDVSQHSNHDDDPSGGTSTIVSVGMDAQRVDVLGVFDDASGGDRL
jgi:hypothetical protein